MFINKTRVQNVDFAKKFIKDGKLYIGVPADDTNIKKLGIDINRGETSVLPAGCFGKNCRHNTDGEWVTDKNGKKEPRHINTVKWSWRDWAGNEHSDWCDVYKECYPKYFIEPALVEIQLYIGKEKKYLASVLNVSDFDKQKNIIKQTINMYLEIFGYCLIYDENFSIDVNQIKRCQWEFLPPDEKIWVTSQWHQNMGKKNENHDEFFQFRLDTINSFSPNETYIGEKGMTGYFAFVFDDFCIFENGKYGHATFITKADNWQELSQMTKKELFESNNVLVRLVHQKFWFDQIQDFIINKKAK